MKTLTEAIMHRSSIRTYLDKSIPKIQRKQIERILSNSHIGPFGHKCRFELIEGNTISNHEKLLLAGDGVDGSAPLYIAGAVKAGKHDIEDFAYCLERIILKATRLGLGTCWFNSTPARQIFARKMAVTKQENMPAISPLGYFQYKKALSIQIMKLMAHNRKRKPWKVMFFDGSPSQPPQPLTPATAGSYRIPLEAVQVAPSAGNTQPWRIVRETGKTVFHFYLAAEADRLATGIAMCHFETAANELGLYGKWVVLAPGITVPEAAYAVSWTQDIR